MCWWHQMMQETDLVWWIPLKIKEISFCLIHKNKQTNKPWSFQLCCSKHNSLFPLSCVLSHVIINNDCVSKHTELSIFKYNLFILYLQNFCLICKMHKRNGSVLTMLFIVDIHTCFMPRNFSFIKFLYDAGLSSKVIHTQLSQKGPPTVILPWGFVQAKGGR